MFTTLFLDAAGTLIHTAEPVAEVYARHFAAHGAMVDPGSLAPAFARAFQSAPTPAFADHPDGHTAERIRWRALVQAVLHACPPHGPPLADSARFDPCFTDLYAYYADPTAWSVFPDTLPFLEAASGPFRLAVVSNFDQRLHRVLEGLGLSRYLDLVLTSGDARCSKPDPGIFREALRITQSAPSQTAHVGDCPRADLAGARAAGLAAFLLDRPRLGLFDFLEFCR